LNIPDAPASAVAGPSATNRATKILEASAIRVTRQVFEKSVFTRFSPHRRITQANIVPPILSKAYLGLM
jgi:hypothetical protein